MDQNFMYEGDKFGYTPVHRAAKHGHIHILEFLFNHCCYKEPLTNDGKSPLHIGK